MTTTEIKIDPAIPSPFEKNKNILDAALILATQQCLKQFQDRSLVLGSCVPATSGCRKYPTVNETIGLLQSVSGSNS